MRAGILKTWPVDKHQRPEAKQQAETKFHRIQEAYEGKFVNI